MEAPPREEPARVDPLTAEKSRLHVTVSRRFPAKLAAARDALSHSHPGASDETIIEILGRPHEQLHEVQGSDVLGAE